ncbi:MAG: tRNA (adenosine(37)-N6)-threonylcarbamoyltransferase complex ATPase subunit type 1 TsaE [Clostridia bacterium]|nr:tRNA (adenosine(37)-N6)-threonylcarbamoyltransferase complex ATPase subunit type 1 TsaE [Clostridia bacterium]
MKYCCNLSSPEETFALGEKISKNLKSGAFIALRGDLGAGKTVLVKGMAKGLGITQRVTSPTFTIMCQYFGNKELYHFDLYRVTEDECYDLGFDDFFFDETVICAVEWSENLSSFPSHTIEITVNKIDEEKRQIEIIDGKNLLKEEFFK